ncbi:MAG: hypothetical protein QME58_14440, partial [Bacteroidota bacterium]|nr:hypothetical protein [Bacteroidota bacterium]
MYAQIPRTLSYQGVLTDSLGNPKPDDSYSITYRLYETSSGGIAIWTEQKILQVKRGLFSTILGDQVPFSADVKFDRPYWMSLQVAAEPELLSRIPLTAVGYSLNSSYSDTAKFALSTPQQAFVDSSRIAGTIPDNTVTSPKILDGTILFSDIGINGAAANQVIKRNPGNTARIAGEDETGIAAAWNLTGNAGTTEGTNFVG